MSSRKAVSSFEIENVEEATRLTTSNDFGVLREIAVSKNKRVRSIPQILIWIFLIFSAILFLALHVSEKHSNEANRLSTSNAPLFLTISFGYYKNKSDLLFADFQKDVDYKGRQREQTSNKGMVTTDDGDCSDMAGLILKEGGNAVDAAVVAALCMGICHPSTSGAGGGTFIVVHLSNGTNTVIDSREVAPSASFPEMFKNRSSFESSKGGLSIGVPLELKGLEMMWKHYGTLSWKRLLERVIPLARDGFPASRIFIDHLMESTEDVPRFDYVRDTFGIFENGIWRYPNVGEMCCKREALAQTLEKMADLGVEAVYNSEWGDDLAEDIRNFPIPGIITKEDLIAAKPVMKEAVKTTVFGMDVIVPPPPSSGAIMLMAMKLMDTYEYDADEILNDHRLLESMRHYFAVRSHFGDPGIDNKFGDMDKIVEDILKDSFIQELRKATKDTKTQEITNYGGKYSITHESTKDGGTEHICVVDAEGNAVSMTTSINLLFGSRMISPKTGLLLNDHMDDFEKSDINSPNNIQPGKKPLSSMSPTIFLENGKPRLVIGVAGGLRITTTILQIAYRYMKGNFDLSSAIQEPRLFYLSMNKTRYEKDGHGSYLVQMDNDTIEGLKQRGHDITNESFLSSSSAIETSENGMKGVSDPRRDGAAASIL